MPKTEEEDEDDEEEEEYPPTLADKLRLLFDALHPTVADGTQPVWPPGDLLRGFNGNFNLYVRSRDLVKQEGIVFRHLLRLILLCGEFAQVTPTDADPAAWQAELRELADRLTASCREVDPASTDHDDRTGPRRRRGGGRNRRANRRRNDAGGGEGPVSRPASLSDLLWFDVPNGASCGAL